MNTKSFEIFLTPDVKELGKTNLPDPDLLEYYKRLVNREILWNCEIDDTLVEYYQQIVQWNREDKDINIKDRKPIKIIINSNGGDLVDVLNFIDIIKLSKTPVITIGMGKCYSSGGLLLMAGHKRYIMPNTSLLIHDGQGGAIGDTGKVLDNLEFTKDLEDKVKNYILSNTKITEELYDKNYRRDWFMFSDDIIKYHIADIIVDDLEIMF